MKYFFVALLVGFLTNSIYCQESYKVSEETKTQNYSLHVAVFFSGIDGKVSIAHQGEFPKFDGAQIVPAGKDSAESSQTGKPTPKTLGYVGYHIMNSADENEVYVGNKGDVFILHPGKYTCESWSDPTDIVSPARFEFSVEEGKTTILELTF